MSNSLPKRKIWNYQPADLVSYNPLFIWPPKIGQSFNWMVRRWICVSRFVLFIALGFTIQEFLTPSYEVMKGLRLDWVLSIFLRNTALLFLIAGSLHLYLHSLKVQGNKFKFLKREMDTDNRVFTFNNQVYDNIFWSVVSGVTVWTIYEALYLTLVARGLVVTAPLADYPFQFFVWILCFPLIRGVHFYFMHRLLHDPFFYKHVHITHHGNVNTGPRSGISMHPIENVIYQFSPMIHFLLPSDPIIFTIHMIMVALNPVFTHLGFEKIVKKDTKILDSADFHHQLHHRYFDCNYGNMDVPLDVWFGTDHDGSDAATQRLRNRKRKTA